MPISRTDLRALDWQEHGPETPCDPLRLVERLREELRELEPVISAAALTSVAFRMRDESGLVTALRTLAQAIEELERRRPEP